MKKIECNVICQTCGKIFHKKPSHAKRVKRHYCSQKCRRTFRIVKCAYCGKELKRPGIRVKTHNYCNASCQMKYEYSHGRNKKPHENLYKAHKEKCSGKSHYMWKGGKKKWKLKNADFYYQIPWQELRMKIYKRDKWTCQICGVKCGRKHRIQCHHINPYRISHDNSMDNLITLCVSCHRREEIKYYHSLRKTHLELNFA